MLKNTGFLLFFFKYSSFPKLTVMCFLIWNSIRMSLASNYIDCIVWFQLMCILWGHSHMLRLRDFSLFSITELRKATAKIRREIWQRIKGNIVCLYLYSFTQFLLLYLHPSPCSVIMLQAKKITIWAWESQNLIFVCCFAYLFEQQEAKVY